MAWEQSEIRELKENRYVVIDDEPCKIKSIDTSKPGKHGEAKARIEAIGIFDNKKHSLINPVTHKVRVPIIDRRKGQVVSLSSGEANIMDLDNYKTFQISLDEDIQDELEQGQEIMYLETMGKRKITRT
ncbi:MAG: translation initiation factor IF-5A [Thermoplasmatota archaeon]